MELVKSSDPILKSKCEDFNFDNPPFWPVEFAKEVTKFVYDNNGIGLAANQIGLPYRLIAMRGHPENFVCFNPVIIDQSTAKVVLEETSLTYPGLLVKVKRPQHIKVRFRTPAGDVLTKQFTGMTARIFQHLMDHLDGTMYFNKASMYHKEYAFKKWKQK